MEQEFKEDQKQKSKEIASLNKELQALKVTLIGIDGRNGMRSQINSLSEDINDIKDILNKFIATLSILQTHEEQNALKFATKEELRASDSRLYKRINDLSERINSNLKIKEQEQKEHEKYLQSLSTSRKMMLLSVIGLVLTVIINFFL